MTEFSDLDNSYIQIIDGKANVRTDNMLRDKTILTMINDYNDSTEMLLDISAFIIVLGGTATALDTVNKMVARIKNSAKAMNGIIGESDSDKTVNVLRQVSEDSDWLLDSCKFLLNSMGNTVSKEAIAVITVLRSMMKLNDVVVIMWRVDGLLDRILNCEEDE